MISDGTSYGLNATPQNVFTYLLVQNALQNMMDGMIGLYSQQKNSNMLKAYPIFINAPSIC